MGDLFSELTPKNIAAKHDLRGWWDLLPNDIVNKGRDCFIKYLDRAHVQGVGYPDHHSVFKIFQLVQPENVRVVILGQDPYPNGNANGVAFSCRKSISPSLMYIANTVRESFPGKEKSVMPASLNHWVAQGIFLLNTVLSVGEKPGSHADLGWQEFTNGVVQLINTFNTPVIWMLWGKQAQDVGKLLTNKTHLVLKCPHPASAAHNGAETWECDHFVKANEFLEQQGKPTIKWI